MKSGIKSHLIWIEGWQSRIFNQINQNILNVLLKRNSSQKSSPIESLRGSLFNYGRSLLYRSVILAGVAIATHGTIAPVWAAERLTFRIGPIEHSIEVSQLERYVKTGKLSKELEPFEPLLGDTLREALASKLDIDPNIAEGIIDDLLATPAGDRLLKALLLALPENTIEQIKTALQLAIESANGISLIGIFKAFPAENITVDFTGAIAVATRLNTPYWETQILSSILKRELTVETFDRLPDFDPAAAGTLTPQQETFTLIDRDRQRPIAMDIYWGTQTSLLERNRQRSNQATDRPLVVMSHGFGSDRSFLTYLARHLASHGITVVSLEHPGSNREWLTNLPVTINPSQLLPANELIDRPLDISFVLDELEKLNRRSLARSISSSRDFKSLADSTSRLKPTEAFQSSADSTSRLKPTEAFQSSADSASRLKLTETFQPSADSASRLKLTETFQSSLEDFSYETANVLNLRLVQNVSLPTFNTNQVVAIGHSLGGYTVLALAGAELNFQDLQKYCQRRQVVGRAPADWLQCAAVAEDLPNGKKKMKLGDERIVGAIALNPITGHIFGEKGLKKVKTPTLLVAGTDDPWTPAVTHQLRPFLDLPEPKYLVTAIDGTHYSATDPNSLNPMKTDNIFENEIDETESEAQRQLVRGVTLAFIQQQTAEAKTYQPFLTATYAQTVSTDDLPLRLNTELSSRLAAWLKNREETIGNLP